MGKQKIFRFVVILASMCASSCKLYTTAYANGWEKLNLSSTTIEGATVHYEKSLKSKLPIFEKVYKQYLVQRNKDRRALDSREKIIAEIKKILGITGPDTAQREKMFDKLPSIPTIHPDPLYLVKQTTIRDFLRSGGELPGFTYNKSADKVIYKSFLFEFRDSRPDRHGELAIPVASEETFAEDINTIFQGLVKGRGYLFIHEVVEAVIVMERLKPQDPYWRWFSDGFANAITYELLKKYVSMEDADEFAAGFDVNDYSDLQKEINLVYWMASNFCIKTPLAYESHLENARYAYATLEAQRLIENYGINCAGKILDEVCTGKSRTSQALTQAIKKITGVDMQERLRRYQTFETRKDGINKYNRLFKAAFSKKDYEQALINLLRGVELHDSQLSPASLKVREIGAWLLFKLGYEKAGDETMISFMKELEENAPHELYDLFSVEFVIYALQCNNPQKAKAIAESVLAKNPNHLPALTVRMKLLADAGKLVEAKAIAKRILDFVDDTNSPYLTNVSIYKAASEVLATDQNQ